jgi:hypothetical protein
MIKRFLACGAMLVLGLWLAGCGGGSLAQPVVAAPEVLLLVGEAALDLSYATFAPINGDLTGTAGNLPRMVAEDCDTARWLPYWTALLNGARQSPMTTTIGDVTATLTLAPLAGDPAYQYTFTLVLDGTDVDLGQVYAQATLLTGRLGVDLAQPSVIRLELTPVAAPAATITVVHDTAVHTRVIEVTTARLRAHTAMTLAATGAVAAAECRYYARAAAERLVSLLRFDAADNAVPDLAPGMRLAAWVYDPAGDPAEDGLALRLLLKHDGNGVLRTYTPLLGWSEKVVSMG